MPGKYKRAYCKGPEKTEHRAIWSSVYGPIPHGYDIHHKDGDKENNDIDNLECLTRAEHIRRHRVGCYLSTENARKLHDGAKNRWDKYRGELPEDHKTCSKCKNVLPVNFFYTNPSQYDGFAPYCKICQNKYAKDKRKEQPATQLASGERTCGKCKALLDISYFPKNKAQYGGYGHYCKQCQKEANKKSSLRKKGEAV